MLTTPNSVGLSTLSCKVGYLPRYLFIAISRCVYLLAGRLLCCYRRGKSISHEDTPTIIFALIISDTVPARRVLDPDKFIPTLHAPWALSLFFVSRSIWVAIIGQHGNARSPRTKAMSPILVSYSRTLGWTLHDGFRSSSRTTCLARDLLSAGYPDSFGEADTNGAWFTLRARGLLLVVMRGVCVR